MLPDTARTRPNSASNRYGTPWQRFGGDRARHGVLKALGTPLARALARPLVAPRALDDYLQLLGPMWSVDEVRARIVEVRPETSDVTSLLLRPSQNWRPHVAGQHVLFTVDIDGVRQTRSFSLSQAPGGGPLLRVTIKAHPRGCVSVWARDRAQVGDVVSLSTARGDFVLPEPLPKKLLFISGGSGITPLVAMAQQLAWSGYNGDLCWIHCERGDIPLEAELRGLNRAIGQASLHVFQDPERHVTREQITGWARDWAEREAFVCGPRGLMELVESLYAEHDRASQVHGEDYQPRWLAPPAQPIDRSLAGRLAFVRSGRQARAEVGVPLLVQAERAGLHPAYGCRRGICHMCKCKKLAGTVRNELTGETNNEPEREIQLCIHSPLGDVSIDL